MVSGSGTHKKWLQRPTEDQGTLAPEPVSDTSETLQNSPTCGSWGKPGSLASEEFCGAGHPPAQPQASVLRWDPLGLHPQQQAGAGGALPPAQSKSLTKAQGLYSYKSLLFNDSFKAEEKRTIKPTE